MESFDLQTVKRYALEDKDPIPSSEEMLRDLRETLTLLNHTVNTLLANYQRDNKNLANKTHHQAEALNKVYEMLNTLKNHHPTPAPLTTEHIVIEHLENTFDTLHTRLTTPNFTKKNLP